MDNIRTEVMEALNEVAKVVNNTMFKPKSIDVGKVLFVIHRKRGAYGYCYVSCEWELDGVPIREIAITPEGLNRPIPAIITTIAHELVHASNCIDGLNDCNGAKHNNRFKTRCDLVGLPAEKHEKYGWTTSCELWDAEEMEDLISKIDPRHVKILEELNNKSSVVRTKAKDKNLSVHICTLCGVKARAKPTANLICGDCDEKMEVEE